MKNDNRLHDLPVFDVDNCEDQPASDIGSDQDFQNRLTERSEQEAQTKAFASKAAALSMPGAKWKDVQKAVRGEFETKDREESSSIRRASLLREGFHAGSEAAANDYSNGTATLEHFEELRGERDITDFYSIGFELGYFRKLAEILVG